MKNNNDIVTLKAESDLGKRLFSELSLAGRQWLKRQIDKDLVQQYEQVAGLTIGMAEILAGRKIAIEKISHFLNPRLRDAMTDPTALKDMLKASELLLDSIKRGDKIALYADYDVDGASSVAMLHEFLSVFNNELIIYIPDRLKEGYGPNRAAIKNLKEQGVKLFIFLDCGAAATNLLIAECDDNIVMLVLDHHLAESNPIYPNNLAVVNPNRFDEDGNYHYLCAAGVVFLFLTVLRKKILISNESVFEQTKSKLPELLSLLDLAALATVADVVPLVGLNRAIVAQGLKILSFRERAGVRAMAEILHLDDIITSGHLGFYLAPLLNAGSRMGRSRLAAELLTTKKSEIASSITLELFQLNETRKAVEQSFFQEALALAKADTFCQKQNLVMVKHKSWHHGVLGIIASRLQEFFQKPAIVASYDDTGLMTASARSIKGIDIGSVIIVLKQAGKLLSGGGHQMAAGLKAKINGDADWQELRQDILLRINQQCGGRLPPKIKWVDTILPLSALTPDFALQLESIAPFGVGNETPLILVRNAVLQKSSWLKEIHFSAFFTSGNSSKSLRVLMFRALGNQVAEAIATSPIGSKFHLLGKVSLNEWENSRSVDFFLEDAMPAKL